ncbi:MAG: RNA polymerase sigma factor [Thermoleophilaceae bacterium]
MLGERFDRTLAAARAGDEEAWTQLYRELAPPLLGYLRGKGAPEPEDLLGEVLLQMVRDLERFEGGERSFRAWVFTIAHHRMLDAQRRRGRRPVEPVADEDLLRRTATADLEEEALARVRAGELGRVLDGLTPDQRSVLLLRVFGELTVDEVARVLGRRPGAVKALQRRALAAVQRALGSLGAAVPDLPVPL